MTGLLSPVHIALVALVLLLVFGGRRLPQIGRLTGSALRSHFLGGPPAEAPRALPEPAASGPGARPVLVRQAPAPSVNDAMRAQAKRHVMRTVLRRVPGPIGWLARILVR